MNPALWRIDMEFSDDDLEALSGGAKMNRRKPRPTRKTGVCPVCNYCEHCGQSRPVVPYVPYIQPAIPQPYIYPWLNPTWCNDNTTTGTITVDGNTTVWNAGCVSGSTTFTFGGSMLSDS